MYSFPFIKGYAYSKFSWGLTVQTRTFIFRFMEVDPSGSNSSHFAYSFILQLLQSLNNPLFHQMQNTVKLTFCLQSHTATTTALLTHISIRAARFCQQNLFSSCIYLNKKKRSKDCTKDPMNHSVAIYIAGNSFFPVQIELPCSVRSRQMQLFEY